MCCLLRVYEGRKDLFKDNHLVFVQGKAEENGDKIKLIVERIYSIDTFSGNSWFK